MTAVIDASSLIILAKVNALEMLFTVYGPVAITDAVFREVVLEGKKRGYTDAWVVEAALDHGWLTQVALTLEEEDLIQQYRTDYPVLGLGECQALACAERRDWLLIVEERKTKTLAQARGLKYTIALTTPVEGYLSGEISCDEAVALLEKIGVAMNTDLAVLNALTATLAAVEEERKKGSAHG